MAESTAAGAGNSAVRTTLPVTSSVVVSEPNSMSVS